MTGIAQGRVVRFVMIDGTTRTALITNIVDPLEGVVDLAVHRIARKDPIHQPVFEVSDVKYDVLGSHGTWSFPVITTAKVAS